MKITGTPLPPCRIRMERQRPALGAGILSPTLEAKKEAKAKGSGAKEGEATGTGASAGGRLKPIAASVLMQVLYVARMARMICFARRAGWLATLPSSGTRVIGVCFS